MSAFKKDNQKSGEQKTGLPRLNPPGKIWGKSL